MGGDPVKRGANQRAAQIEKYTPSRTRGSLCIDRYARQPINRLYPEYPMNQNLPCIVVVSALALLATLGLAWPKTLSVRHRVVPTRARYSSGWSRWCSPKHEPQCIVSVNSHSPSCGLFFQNSLNSISRHFKDVDVVHDHVNGIASSSIWRMHNLISPLVEFIQLRFELFISLPFS